jgi:hypothetical protein
LSVIPAWIPRDDVDDTTARLLLAALRAAGCNVFLDAEDGEMYVSPPSAPIAWDEDPEEAIERHRAELRALIRAEMMTIH